MINNILLNKNLSSRTLNRLDGFFVKQNLKVKNDIFVEKRNEFFKLKNENPSADFAALELSSFYKAIQNFYDLKEKATKKNKTMSTQSFKKYENFIIKSTEKSKKFSRKENFLLDKSSIINSLIIEKISYREMSNFINNHYRINISHTYIKHIVGKYPLIFRQKEEKIYD